MTVFSIGILHIVGASHIQGLNPRKKLLDLLVGALFHSTPHCPNQLGTIDRDIRSQMEKCATSFPLTETSHQAKKSNSKNIPYPCCYTYFVLFPRKRSFKITGKHTGPRKNTFFGFENWEKACRSEKQLRNSAFQHPKAE